MDEGRDRRASGRTNRSHLPFRRSRCSHHSPRCFRHRIVPYLPAWHCRKPERCMQPCTRPCCPHCHRHMPHRLPRRRFRRREEEEWCTWRYMYRRTPPLHRMLHRYPPRRLRRTPACRSCGMHSEPYRNSPVRHRIVRTYPKHRPRRMGSYNQVCTHPVPWNFFRQGHIVPFLPSGYFRTRHSDR